MTEKDYQVFGSICADSTVYNSLSDTFSLHNHVSDIKKLVSTGRASVGTLTGTRFPIIVRYRKIGNTILLGTICRRIEIWSKVPSDSTEDLAWTYIDILSSLKVQINLRKALYRSGTSL